MFNYRTSSSIGGLPWILPFCRLNGRPRSLLSSWRRILWPCSSIEGVWRPRSLRVGMKNYPKKSIWISSSNKLSIRLPRIQSCRNGHSTCWRRSSSYPLRPSTSWMSMSLRSQSIISRILFIVTLSKQPICPRILITIRPISSSWPSSPFSKSSLSSSLKVLP